MSQSEVEALITVLSAILSLMAIWWLLFWLVRDYRVDSFREQIFALRAELFDEADSVGSIDFDHPAYGLLRTTMNGFIRFGHRINLFQILVMLLFVDLRQVTPFSERWKEAIQDLDPDVRKRLNEFYVRMNILIARHMILGSPTLLLTVFAPVLFLISIKYYWKLTVSLFRTRVDQLDSLAMVEGR